MDADIAIIGAGAAGLGAAIAAGESAGNSHQRIILLDSARQPGAKILISGGGRCNVTNDRVRPEDFWGGPRAIVRKVLQQFDERQTIAWFAGMGVHLKIEPSTKYFPVTDRAQTVLDALLHRAGKLGVTLVPSTRVENVRSTAEGFELVVGSSALPSPLLLSLRRERGDKTSNRGTAPGSRAPGISARRVIVATGGMTLPKSGSNGAMLEVMRRLGHSLVPTTPALAPLILKKGTDLGGHFAEFRGVSIDARLRLYQEVAGIGPAPPSSCLMIELAGSLLFTHVGVSGPVALDMSRHWLRARLAQPNLPVTLVMGLPQFATVEEADRWLLQQAAAHPRQHAATALAGILPERIARTMADVCAGDEVLAHLTRERRQQLAQALTMLPLPVIGSRGYQYAEATAGGVDLHDIDARTMQSRRVPGLYLCGEILDVDGRIGGFNFQWAWSSGHVAGRAAAREHAEESS